MLLFPVFVFAILLCCILVWDHLRKREARLGPVPALRRLHALMLLGGGAAALAWAFGLLLPDRVLQPAEMLLPVVLLMLPLWALLLVAARATGQRRALADVALIGAPATLAVSVVLVWTGNWALDRSDLDYVALGPARIETREYPLLGQRHAVVVQVGEAGSRELRLPLNFVRYRELQRLWLGSEAESVMLEQRSGALGLRWVRVPADGF